MEDEIEMEYLFPIGIDVSNSYASLVVKLLIALNIILSKLWSFVKI